MKHVLLLFVSIIFILACKPNPISENLNQTESASKVKVSDEFNKAEIKQVLMDQQAAWSKGDIDAFMEGYWQSEDLTFIGRSGINKGWQTTKDNYIKGYPDKAAMGRLEFEVLELVPLSETFYRMVGTYKLIREKDTPSGIFTLLWQKIDGHWKIIYDHTCG